MTKVKFVLNINERDELQGREAQEIDLYYLATAVQWGGRNKLWENFEMGLLN